MFSPRTNQLQPVLTVSQLTACIKDVLEVEFDNVYVVGEVSNAKIYPSGHWYFSLKDKDATLPCVCFRMANSSLKFKLEDGLMLVARGRMNLYLPKGAYQLNAVTLEPVGIGDWQLAFEQLRDQLEREGLLRPELKKPIPMLPRRIGIVTSPVGAAVRDVISALSRRNRNVHIVVAPVRVQGEGSAEEIAKAIDYLHRIPDIDVIILARGGGSIEDLWAFNTEIVARAVVDSAIPIISGVGHETDTTICDLVADLRAPTPTAAAELVARGSAELLERWRNLQKQMLMRGDAKITRARRDLEKLKPLHVLMRYAERLKRDSQKVKHLRDRMNRSITHSLDRSRRRWFQQHEKLQALGPVNVLNRGYAIVKTDEGTIVRDTAQVAVGQELIAYLNSGKLRLRVEAIEEQVPPVPPPPDETASLVKETVAEFLTQPALSDFAPIIEVLSLPSLARDIETFSETPPGAIPATFSKLTPEATPSLFSEPTLVTVSEIFSEATLTSIAEVFSEATIVQIVDAGSQHPAVSTPNLESTPQGKSARKAKPMPDAESSPKRKPQLNGPLQEIPAQELQQLLLFAPTNFQTDGETT